MAADGKDGQKNIATVSEESKPTSLADDLDKNPIKYATHEPGVMTTDPHDKPYMEMTLRAGKHSERVQKLLRQRIETRAKEFPRWPGNVSSGVRAVWIESRFWYDRERLGPDFDEDWRSYRARYLHSLELDPREPVHVPEYETELLNPIRRFYMKGGDWIENKICRLFTDNKYKSSYYRVCITRSFMLYVGLVGLYYYNRFHHRQWEQPQGLGLLVSAPIMYPNHPKYPFEDPRTEQCHHLNMGFVSRSIFKDLRDYQDNSVVL